MRAGYLALRRIAAYFGIPTPRDPEHPQHPISVTRQEFDQACDEMAEQGVPLKEDRELAWQEFAGWRVNYDRSLLALCALTMAPQARWSSDRVEYWDIRDIQGDALDRLYEKMSS